MSAYSVADPRVEAVELRVLIAMFRLSKQRAPWYMTVQDIAYETNFNHEQIRYSLGRLERENLLLVKQEGPSWTLTKRGVMVADKESQYLRELLGVPEPQHLPTMREYR